MVKSDNVALIGKPKNKSFSTDITVSAEEYLNSQFSLEPGETLKKIIPMWAINYRINMWAGHLIKRSFFVQVKKNSKGKWTHKVLPD